MAMKFLLALIFSISFNSIATADEYQPGYSRTRTCTRNEYKEEYFPGTEESPGYVESWTETVVVPCSTTGRSTKQARPSSKQTDNTDNNDCRDGSIIGGLLGAGLTMSGTRGKDRWWAVPAGGAAGAMVGCSLDGG